jgi:arginase
LRHRYAILEAPSALGHVPEHQGVERAPSALLQAGLADGLDARRAGCVLAGGYSGVPDPQTKLMNTQPLRDYSSALADQVGAIVGNGEFPVVLGGDCSLLLGAMLALRRRGRYGMLYIDGDADFYQPEVNPLRGAASASDLAFATGRGPDIVCDLEGRLPRSATATWPYSTVAMRPTGNAAAANCCPPTCWSWTATRSARPAPKPQPARR